MAKEWIQMTEDRKQKAKNRRQYVRICSLTSVLCLLFLSALLFISMGCAASGKKPSLMPNSTNQQQAASTSNAALASADSVEFDDEFALLEEELIEEMEIVKVPDPLEPVNRIMFGFNDVLYFWVAKPILQVYTGVVPELGRVGIRNFFNNVTTPVRLVNCLLQGKNDAANIEFHRFVINTTEGIFGLGDPALDKHGLKTVREDLGQTLAVYGFEDGLYIVWPFFGPSTARDSIGMVGDQFLNPVRYVDPRDVSIGISVVKGVNAGSFQIGTYEEFKAASLEPYIAMRELYIQYRHKQIQE